jgi:plasmid stabilization system protein ParE
VRLELLPAARSDPEEAAAWYSERSERAAARFVLALDDAPAAILAAPERWGLVDDLHRVKVVQRFPYHVVYRLDGARIVVVAVAHGAREPGFWSGR